MQGLGQGMIYGTILQMAQRWFLGRTGFASGIVVTANGLCGFFITPISKYLLENSGPEIAFLVIGTAIAVTWVLGYIFIREPQDANNEEEQVAKKNAIAEQRQYVIREMLKTAEFYYLFLNMLCGLTAYFIMSPISQVIQIQRGISSGVAMWSVMLGSVMNAAMRLLLPSITSQIFGVEHTGENYGYLMISIIGATFLAQLINNAITVGYNDRIAFIAGALLVLTAMVGTILLNRRRKKLSDNMNRAEHIKQ